MGNFKKEYKKSKRAISYNTLKGFKDLNEAKKGNEDDVIAKEIGLKSRAKIKEEKQAKEFMKNITPLEYPIPEVYKQLDNYDTNRAISRQELYNIFSRISPYLIKRLLYESADEMNTGAVRVMASKVLLDKIFPNVSATEVNLSSEDIQSLVIVKTNKTR